MSHIKGINHIGLTVLDIDEATTFLKEAFGAKIAYDALTYDDEPREGVEVERMLGLTKGAKIVRQRMIVIGNGPNIEMFEVKSNHQKDPLKLEDLGYHHISFMVDEIEAVLDNAIRAGAEPLSETHDNSTYEDSKGSKSVYVKAPFNALIELQTIPNGYYYPKDSEANVFIPGE
ncbi:MULTISPECIES: VOC family protein [Staphylococcus]|uniref:VOC family protein n=1 Tax=Staphylococcus sp. GDY8P47P TaxID=2804491 RepID=UPI001950B25F|nr:VOC family protein [Staphylococcus sp. GDY8P47P]